MLRLFLQVAGWILARLPVAVLRVITAALATLVWWLYASRRRLILSNLHHAFPARSATWRSEIGRECMRRVVETGLFSLALPFLSADRLRRHVRADASLQNLFARHRATPCPLVICTPHVAHWETGPIIPLLVDGPFPEFGVIFRPLDNPGADAWIKQSRERFGMKLLSRRAGVSEAIRILERNGCAAVLFDQNSGPRGALTTLFGRVCSTTSMPGTFAERTKADVATIYPRHLGFWQVELHSAPIAFDGTVAGLTVALNRWLENLLTQDDGMCASWLWGHQRWKTQDAPPLRFRLEQQLNFLPEDLRLRGLAALPQRTRIWVRLPNWLGDVVMALPLLRALRAARPDAEITFVAKAAYLPLLERLALADRLRPLPRTGGVAYFGEFRRAREDFIDCYLLFTNSTRGDLEAWSTRARQRFGIARPGKRRRLLTHRFKLPAAYDEAKNHQFALWTDFMRHFGLVAPVERTPFALSGVATAAASPSAPIGLICGSENTPEKRWPVEHWRALIAALPAQRFVLLGTANDRLLTDAVAAGFDDRVENLAGRTDLVAFAERLQSCALLVANDTGGMHLANALGVPVIGLFGPTNPVRTGPIFAAPAVLLQPPGCPATGGGSLADLLPTTVAGAVDDLLKLSRA